MSALLSRFLELIGRKKKAPTGFRNVYLNDPIKNDAQNFLHNGIDTAKYSSLNFLPKFLIEQFSKYANIFFLFSGLIQLIPGISPTSKFTTILPLLFVLIFTAIKEAIEDLKRHRTDNEVNARLVKVLNNLHFIEKRWDQVKVGDIVRIENGDFFSADIVLLSSSEPDAICYIETSNLDGETNLKIKQGRKETSKLLSPEQVNSLAGRIESEQPNNSLYTFEGRLQLETGETIPLDPNQILLRGAQLRNTNWVYGVVIFTGHETKLLRNTSATPIKRTDVERMTNRQIVFLLMILVCLALSCAIGSLYRDVYFNPRASYLFVPSYSNIEEFIRNFLTFMLLFNNLIPISLIVTMEVVKYHHAQLINADLDMYYEPTNTPALCRTSSLVEELGQIEYIFTDKTGTLTCNIMQFRQCIIAGICFSDKLPPSKKNGEALSDQANLPLYDFQHLQSELAKGDNLFFHHFLLLLASCHTVIPELDDSIAETTPIPERYQHIVYQASSPDEGALVQGARALNFIFHTRRPTNITVQVQSKDMTLEVLKICEFNSTRKRMSAVLRLPDQSIVLYCKGADTVILERLDKSTGINPYVDSTLLALEEYAGVGLRTLCLAYRFLSPEEYQTFSKKYDEAACALVNRGEELAKVAEEIEHDLILLGATAIEDRLQDGVPETIATLSMTGIKIWMLTGDRQETAINIGYSCKLLTEDMHLISLNYDTYPETQQELEKQLSQLKTFKPTSNPNPDSSSSHLLSPKQFLDLKNLRTIFNLSGPLLPKLNPVVTDEKQKLDPRDLLALIIDGRTLDFALEKSMEKQFLELASMCKAVICCRVSPLQKALVVKLVKRYQTSLLLAIGDGANDVSMIQAAHVGIGISGMEGLQAARSSDFAISQFKYLRKLLLVHGTWSYQRLSKLILYCFYKNITLYVTQFWFTLFSGFSGQTIYESWIISLYNVAFTLLPPLVIGIFDQLADARMLDRYPQLYTLGQRGEFFNVKIFWAWAINAFWHSLLLFFMLFTIFMMNNVLFSSGYEMSHWALGCIMYTSVLTTVILKAALVTNLWTYWALLATLGSVLLWLVFLPIYSVVFPSIGISHELQGISIIYTTGVFWFSIILIPSCCILRDFAWKYYRRMYLTKPYHVIQEIQKYNLPDYRPRMERFRQAVHKVRIMQRMKRNRGFAFAQGDSGQADLIRVYDTTLRKPKG
ncbi:hypothetical protein HMI54_011154 [Coelomomyces lativittatus]|nr:hypothetical protein HMI55_001896 [Coelomomyces lativittatus]KAJ1518698.1 hypothetical protein HMI54_011154 [Coelomomyces lativittatus]